MSANVNREDALVLVQLRNQFYRKKYHLVLGIFTLNIILMGILLSVFLYLFGGVTRPLYFVANEIGSFVQEIPNDQPFPLDQVINWTINAVEASTSFDFVNYRSQMQDAQKYFTDYSWGQYMKGLVDSNNILTLTDPSRLWVWIPKVTEQPKLIKQGVISGHYAWKFQMPVLITFLRPPTYDKKTALYNAWKMEVIVIRQPLLQSYNGLAIYTIIYTTADTQTPLS